MTRGCHSHPFGLGGGEGRWEGVHFAGSILSPKKSCALGQRSFQRVGEWFIGVSDCGELVLQGRHGGGSGIPPGLVKGGGSRRHPQPTPSYQTLPQEAMLQKKPG